MVFSGRAQMPLRSPDDQADCVQVREKLRIGVLGGMGPAATIDFMTKVRAASPALRDQDHIPLIVQCVPQIPDRSTAVLARTNAPLPHLLGGVRLLQDAGVHAIAIACVKAGELALAREAGAQAARLPLGSQGVDLLLIACTELPIAMQDSVYTDRCIDAT